MTQRHRPKLPVFQHICPSLIHDLLTFCLLSQLILTATRRSRCHQPYFMDVKTEAQNIIALWLRMEYLCLLTTSPHILHVPCLNAKDSVFFVNVWIMLSFFTIVFQFKLCSLDTTLSFLKCSLSFSFESVSSLLNCICGVLLWWPLPGTEGHPTSHLSHLISSLLWKGQKAVFEPPLEVFSY